MGRVVRQVWRWAFAFWALLLLALVGTSTGYGWDLRSETTAVSFVTAADEGVGVGPSSPLGANSPGELLSSDLAAQISNHISAQDWLGPIAAIAISPFFGLACLSGMATYGPDSLRAHTALLSDHGPMASPALFWTMAFLTLVTSLPRLTKVSKPIALLAEKIEAYSAILILVSMRFAHWWSGGSVTEEGDLPALAMAGLGVWGGDVIMSVAAALNLIVINTVKLAIEFVVWLVPVPFVDSLFELFNKTLCAGLAFLYAYSPAMSLILNLLVFVVCALVFMQVVRYLRYFKTLYIWPTVRLVQGIDESAQSHFPAFTLERWRGIPSHSALSLVRSGATHVEVYSNGWLSRRKLGVAKWTATSPGLIVDRAILELEGTNLKVEVRRGTFGKRGGEVLAVPTSPASI